MDDRLDAILRRFTSVQDLPMQRTRTAPGEYLSVRRVQIDKWRARIERLEARVYDLENELAEMRAEPKTGHQREVARLRRVLITKNGGIESAIEYLRSMHPSTDRDRLIGILQALL